MAPPKKKDEDKSKRLNFTVPPDMYSAFHNRCRSDGREISKTIQELIELFLNDRVCMNTHQINTLKPDDTSSSVIQSLQAQIETLHAQIGKIELKLEPKTNTHQMQIVSTPDEPAETSVIPAPVKPETVIPEPAKPAPITVNPETDDDDTVWISNSELKKMFKPEYSSNASNYAHMIEDYRNGTRGKEKELVGMKRSKYANSDGTWHYSQDSIEKFFENHPEYRKSAEHTI